MKRGLTVEHSLIFHIGAHRTGTSAVQHFLHDNIPALKRQGVLYPFRTRRHVHLINQLFSGARRPQQVAADLMRRLQPGRQPSDRLREQTPGRPPALPQGPRSPGPRSDGRSDQPLGQFSDPVLHSVVLSDEDICMRQDISLLGEFRSEFNVKVVFTLRRQDLWLESWYLQNIKWQWNPRLSHCTLPEFLEMREEFHWIHYDRYVHHLEKVFGRENIILNLYEPGQMPAGGAVQMFCDSIGLRPGADFVQPTRVNPSFSPEVSEFMRCLPLDAAPEKYRAMLTAACAEIDARRPGGGQGRGPGGTLLIAPEQRAAIMAQYAPGNRALAQRYFGRDQLFLDPLPDAAAPLARMALPQDSQQLMAEFVAPLLQAMIVRRRQEMGRKKAKRLAREKAAREKSTGEAGAG